jgi:hypothetical protein
VSDKAIDWEYDPTRDLATIQGVEWSGDLLRSLGEWAHHPNEIPPLGYLFRVVSDPNALPYGVRFERVPSFDKLIEAAEGVYVTRGELFNEPNTVHRKILKMGFMLNEVRGLAPAQKSFYEERMDALQRYQKELPEPYRTEICNILANGKPRITE